MIKIIASSDTWLEDEAIQQLEYASSLPGVEMAIGFPDLHPGKGIPVGAAVISRRYVYPHLIGNDIACAMSFWQTDLEYHKTSSQKLAKKLEKIEPDPAFKEMIQKKYQILNDKHIKALGTIGRGNHFAELQQVHEIYDQDSFANLGLQKNQYGLLIHSGSRSLGEEIHQQFACTRGTQGVDTQTKQFREYRKICQYASQWAKANREIIAGDVSQAINANAHLITEVEHNILTEEVIYGNIYWVHRKGAAISNQGPVMIPGHGVV